MKHLRATSTVLALASVALLALLALPAALFASDLRPVYSLPSSRDRVQTPAVPTKAAATPAEKAAQELQSPETSKRFMKTTHGNGPINKTPQKPPASLQ